MNEQTGAAVAPQTQALPPQAIISQLAMGCFVTKALSLAAKLGIADLLKNEARSAEDLAAATDSNADAMYRILRALASCGVFTECAPRVFANTAASEMLASERADSMRDMAIWMGEEPHWRVYGEMDHSLKTGETAWSKVHGEEVFPYLFQTNIKLGEVFNRAMTSFSAGVAPAIAAAYDTSDIETLVDVAGGHGLLLSAFVKANPNLKGILFDLPSVVEGANPTLEKSGAADRIETATGDFFTEVPNGFDAYLMKHIIHDWNDELSIKILEKIHRAMKPDGKVLICEMVVKDGDAPDMSKILDLEMLVSPGGKERTAEEYRRLLAASGFRLTRIIPTQTPYSIVEAVRA